MHKLVLLTQHCIAYILYVPSGRRGWSIIWCGEVGMDWDCKWLFLISCSYLLVVWLCTILYSILSIVILLGLGEDYPLYLPWGSSGHLHHRRHHHHWYLSSSPLSCACYAWGGCLNIARLIHSWYIIDILHYSYLTVIYLLRELDSLCHTDCLYHRTRRVLFYTKTALLMHGQMKISQYTNETAPNELCLPKNCISDYNQIYFALVPSSSMMPCC